MMKDASNLLGKKNVVIFGDSSKLQLLIIIFVVIKMVVYVCISAVAMITFRSVKLRHWDLFEGCLNMYLPHEIKWNANLMQLGNVIDVFLARHVSGTYANHQEN